MPDSTNRSVENIDVAYVANLARLQLTAEEIERLGGQLKEIVGFVRKIGELNLSDIDPTSHASLVVNVFRKDEVRPGLDRQVVLDNAPAVTDGQFQVPRIVE